jgi:hypothetical protein
MEVFGPIVPTVITLDLHAHSPGFDVHTCKFFTPFSNRALTLSRALNSLCWLLTLMKSSNREWKSMLSFTSCLRDKLSLVVDRDGLEKKGKKRIGNAVMPTKVVK